MKATWVEISGNETGAFVAGGSALRKCPTPGKKKSNGETLPLWWTPAQPVTPKVHTVSIASHNNFRFNLTWSQYKTA